MSKINAATIRSQEIREYYRWSYMDYLYKMMKITKCSNINLTGRDLALGNNQDKSTQCH